MVKESQLEAAISVVPLQVFSHQCVQVLEVARVLCEVTALAGLEPQALVLRHIQAELSEVSQSEGVPWLGSIGDAGDAVPGSETWPQHVQGARKQELQQGGASRVVPLKVFSRQCAQILVVAKILCEVTALAGLEPQAAVLQKIQAELLEVAQSEGVPCPGSNGAAGDAAAGAASQIEDAIDVYSGAKAFSQQWAVETYKPSAPKAKLFPEISFLRDVAEATHKLELASAESKTGMDRFAAELEALCSETEKTAGEVQLARKEVHAARAEVIEARAAAESQEVRFRVFAAEVQQLRTHVADSMRRSEEDLEACRASGESNASELLRLVGNVSTEVCTLRQSIAGLEQADRQHQADVVGLESLSTALKQIECTTLQRLSEVSAATELWQNRADSSCKQALVQSKGEILAIMQEELGKMHSSVEKLTNSAAENASVLALVQSADEGSPADLGQEKLHPGTQPRMLQGLQDMPRPWRAALEDAVRRVQWISDEARHEQLKRLEEHQKLVEASLVSANTEQSKRLGQAREVSDEALRRADEAMSIARASREVAQESREANSEKAEAAAATIADEIRAEMKAVTGDLSTRLEDTIRSHRLRFTSLDEACVGLVRDFADLDDISKQNEETARRLDSRLGGVAEVAQRSAQSIEEQKAKFKGFLDPFRDEMDRRFVEVWQESAEVRSLLAQQERKASDDVSSVRAVWQARCEELRSTLEGFSVRLDQEVVQWADHAGKTEALKRRLFEEARSAVDARCMEIGDYGAQLRDTLLQEVKASLNLSEYHSAELATIAAKVAELGAALEFSQGETTSRVEQFQAALAAADRLAAAAQTDACDALRRSKHSESLLISFLHPECAATSADVHEQGDCGAGNLQQATRAGGSGAGAVRQLRSQTPRRPTL